MVSKSNTLSKSKLYLIETTQKEDNGSGKLLTQKNFNGLVNCNQSFQVGSIESLFNSNSIKKVKIGKSENANQIFNTNDLYIDSKPDLEQGEDLHIEFIDKFNVNSQKINVYSQNSGKLKCQDNSNNLIIRENKKSQNSLTAIYNSQYSNIDKFGNKNKLLKLEEIKKSGIKNNNSKIQLKKKKTKFNETELQVINQHSFIVNQVKEIINTKLCENFFSLNLQINQRYLGINLIAK